jgi:hypothetical protein
MAMALSSAPTLRRVGAAGSARRSGSSSAAASRITLRRTAARPRARVSGVSD